MPLFTGNWFGFGRGAAEAAGPPGLPFSGTGGEISAGVPKPDGNTYHYYKTSGNFTVSSDFGLTESQGACDVFILGGGGGGGARSGGGGGAGGLAVGANVPLPWSELAGQNIPITVGAGGEGASQDYGETGGDSKFGADPAPYQIIAKGGGAGSADNPWPAPGGPGGCGGGSQYGEQPAGEGIQPQQNPGMPYVTNYGHDGSHGGDSPGHNPGAGGGCGTAAQNGDNGSDGVRGSAGDGKDLPAWGVAYWLPTPDPYRPGIDPLPGNRFGGGGGAGGYNPFRPQNMPQDATQGGGGIGGPTGSAGNGTPGVNGLGGGGGGAAGTGGGPVSGDGGNGIVVIRYPTP